MAEWKVERQGEIEVWTLDGEGRHNTLTRAAVRELGQRASEISGRPKLRGVVITGAGKKAFCAGADLKERMGMSQGDVRDFLDELNGALSAIERANQIFVGAINGVALGGGAELALACDVRVGSARAEIGFTEVKLGIIPGAGGTQRLPRLVGVGRAKELILSARRIKAAEAQGLGIFSQLAEPGQVLEVATQLASDIAGNAPLALAAAKHAIDGGFGLPIEEGLRLERTHYEQTLGTEDRLEGLKAFAEKRTPKFQGR